MTVRLALVALALALLSPVGGAAAAPAEPATLTSVTARHVGSVDRITFGFRGGLPTTVNVGWDDSPAYDGSGDPARVPGAAFLAVTFAHAKAFEHDYSHVTVRSRKALALPNVVGSVMTGDFEGYVTVDLGLQKRTSYTVTKLHHPDRVVVDVRADFPVTTRKIWLAAADGTVVPRSRPVPADAPAAGALHALFAGETLRERAAGLRLVRSDAWGFADLSVVDGIARVRLTRGCRSAGSTTTVAGEIAPTLRQFPTVDWVKIYGPGGVTEQPSGQVDSIPGCLEP